MAKPAPVAPKPAGPSPAKPAAAKPAPAKPASVAAEAPPPVAAKPADRPASADKPAAAGSESFVVQLAALSDADKAEALKTRASQAGLPAFTDKVGSLTRVRVGPFPSRAAAVAAAVKLAEHNMAGQVLVK